uniref:Alkylated DNA repair protein AlkB homologue 8 N-terminal domain-containing protein n=1 Tax=Oncorhynchus tshawytscha TaxID=74940 RepID=A0AAZ3QQU1_ONCTS
KQILINKGPRSVVSEKYPHTQRQQNKGDDCGLQETAEGAPPIHIDGTVVERVVSFKFLGIHITDKLNWATHTDSIVKKAEQHLFNLRRLKKFGLSPKALTNFYRCTIESILSGCITAWYGNCSSHNRKALQRVVRSAQRITGGKLPALQDTYTTRCHRNAIKIIKDNNHPSHCLFTPLSSRRGGQYRCIKAGTERQPPLTLSGCCQHTDSTPATLIMEIDVNNAI